MSILTDSVEKADDGSWTFQCPDVVETPCGGFTSSGWPTRKVAEARGDQHFTEHVAGAAALAMAPDDALAHITEHHMPSLEAFRDEHGLVPADNGIHAVRMEDLA